VALVGQVSGVAPPGIHLLVPFLASCGVLAVVIGLAVVLPRLGANTMAQLLVPVGYLISLALLFRSQDTVATGLQPLVLVPIVWVALYHRPRESAAVVLGAVCTLGVVSWLPEVPVAVIFRRTGLWGLVGALVVLGAHNLRRWLGDTVEEREEALRQARVLGDVARELNSTLDPRQVVAIAVRLAGEIASPPGRRARRANYCRVSGEVVKVVAEFDSEGEWVGATWPLSEHPHLAEAVRTRMPTTGALDGLGLTVREVNQSQGIGHGGWVPVIVGGDLHGVLAIAGRNRPVSEHDLSLCVSIVRIMELALANALTHQRSQKAALTDPLTLLANRRGMARLVRERRGGGRLAVLAIDVDGLKDINDRYGHAAGDELLRLVADAISSTLRTSDVVARVGGDEFICVLFDTQQDVGTEVAAGILRAISDASADEWQPSVSIGVACALPGAALDAGIRRADRAMYRAKRAGGMRYELAPAPATRRSPIPRADAPVSHILPRAAARRPDQHAAAGSDDRLGCIPAAPRTDHGDGHPSLLHAHMSPQGAPGASDGW
jgi:diguanylate cyclase (GGDEF)-like protein